MISITQGSTHSENRKRADCRDGGKTFFSRLNAALCRSLSGEFHLYWK